MKPLFRITIGPVQELGIRLLRKNVRLLKKNYPEADVVVCFNQIDPNLLNVNVEKINQADFANSLPYIPKLETWKLYPPRLRLSSHEIILDNDILIFRRIAEIDEFLNSNRPLLLKGRRRVYGKYEHLVPQPFAINSGIFGLPPNFDFQQEIKNFCKNDKEKKWTHWCDDQGIIGGILITKNPIFITMESVMNYLSEFNIQPKSNWNGIHLIGSNRSESCMDIVKQLLSCEK
jgi:hypothetical protein